MYKFLFELAIEPLGLPLDWYWEWIILLVIQEIVYEIAYAKVGGLYRSGIISGSAMGSFFHWLIRFIYFVVFWAVTYGIIWIGKFIFAHWKVILFVLLGIIVIVLLGKIIQLRINRNRNKKEN